MQRVGSPGDGGGDLVNKGTDSSLASSAAVDVVG